MNNYLPYICAACGEIVEVPLAAVEPLDSGTTMTCPRCGGDTIVDLSTPEERRRKYLREDCPF